MPSTSNFGNIDAAILLQDGTLLCLQYTVGATHGFNFFTFRQQFLGQLEKDILDQVQRIIVKFVVPYGTDFKTIFVPIRQQVVCIEATCDGTIDPSLKVHYCKPRDTDQAPSTTDGAMTTNLDLESMELSSDHRATANPCTPWMIQ